MTKWFYRIPLGIGCGLMAASTALYVVLDRAASAEQALSPGEKSFGAAALGMMYWPPILALGFAGLLVLLVGMSVLAVHRLRKPD